VYFHGGGFVLGDLRMGDWMCGNVAATVGAVVLSVQYRLGLRHRFPAAVETAMRRCSWAAEHTAELGADPRASPLLATDHTKLPAALIQPAGRA
jgi:acetyl esterase